jgi:hypothetical protein
MPARAAPRRAVPERRRAGGSKVQPSAAASRATAWPMAPRPITATRLPRISKPCLRDLGRRHSGNGLKLCREIWPVLHQVAYDLAVTHKLGHVDLDDSQLRVILAFRNPARR